MVRTTVSTTRQIGDTLVTAEIPIEQLVPGDDVQLEEADLLVRDYDRRRRGAVHPYHAVPKFVAVRHSVSLYR